MSRQDAIKAAEVRLRQGLPRPDKPPKSLPLAAIKIDADLFQWRREASSFHIAELAKTPKEGQPLEAVGVWWGGDGYYLMDGHHRGDAYKAAGWPMTKHVPIAVYTGTLAQALLKAGHGNTPAKLQMSKPEKTQAAWEFVASTPVESAKAAAIARAFSVSERIVHSMRGVVRKLRERDPTEDLSARTWHAARTEAEGGTTERVDYEEWAKTETDRIEGVLREALGTVRFNQRAPFADAIERIVPGGIGFFADYWGMAQEVAEENPDF